MPVLSLTEDDLRARTSLKWRRYPADVLPLWVAEMDVAVHPAVLDAVGAALAAGDTGYPVGSEYEDAFAAVAAARWGWEFDPRAQAVRVGDVMNAILAILEATTEPGDSVVINPPVYPPFRQVVEGYRRRLVEVHLTASGRLDLEGLAEAFAAERPAAYLLCSPHNPTGTVHTREELAAVATLCATYDVQLVVDEIHAVLVDPGVQFVPVLALPEAAGALVATSAGKGWNLAGFKAGLVLGGPDAGDALRSLPPLAAQSTGHLAKIAHTAALRHAQGWVDQLMVEVAANKRLFVGLLAERLPSLTCTPGEGTYLAWVDCAALDVPNPQRHFLEAGRVAFNDGAHFGAGYDRFVRVNLATSPALVTEAVDRMVTACAGLPPRNHGH